MLPQMLRMCSLNFCYCSGSKNKFLRFQQGHSIIHSSIHSNKHTNKQTNILAQLMRLFRSICPVCIRLHSIGNASADAADVQHKLLLLQRLQEQIPKVSTETFIQTNIQTNKHLSAANETFSAQFAQCALGCTA